MADEKKRKKSHATGEPEPAPARDTQDMKAGELLRHVREEKGMELEEVSSAIHVRVVQLRAIEEGHIETLPGMTYALGFVKSYATFLKLDPVAVANKFKAEHSVTPPKPDLKFPEPLAESKMPDPFMIGIAALAGVVVLGFWLMFSGSDDKSLNVAANIPAPPPAEIAPLTAAPAPPTEAAAIPATVPPIIAPPPATATTTTTTTTTPAATPAVPAATTETPAAAATAATTTTTTSPSETAATAPMVIGPAATPKQPAVTQEPLETINIRPGKGRVVLEAKQSSWVQVTDGSGNVVVKKVLRPGERLYVPDQPGMKLVTSNAGGLDVYVDGRTVQQIGGKGEIIRGVPLNPESLSRPRTRVRQHD
ncbi:MAG: helix-turn-helix domain-containing protein [Alphaproteobacteria bacterium]|nr:MAG: helix-turn-helix domain-containing protein [Alphaproteobacteria bacterium]